METKGKILVVDDNPCNRAAIEDMLGDQHEIKSVSSGEEALEVARTFRPDIVLLDVILPGADGYEVCRRIRHSEGLCQVKIIIISVKGLGPERLNGYRAGADEYITKPFNTDELQAKINVFLKLKSIEELERLRNEFTATVTHEMRTPLAIARNALANLGEGIFGPLPEEVATNIQTANKNLDRLGSIISRFFEIAWIEAGKVKLEDQCLEANETLRKVLATVEKKAAKRHVRLEQQTSAKSIDFKADNGKIARALKILLQNIIEQAKPENMVVASAQAKGEWLRIMFEQRGAAQQQQCESHDFQPLTELLRPGVPGYRDIGLGLQLAKTIVELHGGRLAMEKDEFGAAYSVELPLLQAVETPGQEQPLEVTAFTP